MKIPAEALFVVFLLYDVSQVKTSTHSSCHGTKYEGTTCEEDGFSGVCYNQKCFVPSPSKTPFIIKVRYQQDNDHARSSSLDTSKMSLRGNGLGLTWNKGKMMNKSAEKDTWEYLLEYTIRGSSLDGLERPPGRFEFRVFLDDTKDMLGANFLIPLPLSTNTDHLDDGIPVFWVYPWFFSEKGNTKKRTIFTPELSKNRTFEVYSPPSFDENKYKRYESLFMNDGQRLKYATSQFDRLMVDKAVIKEVLVIGVVNSFTERTALLAPSNGTDVRCIRGNRSNSCDNCLKCSVKNPCNYQELIEDYQCYRWVPIPEVHGQRYLDYIQNTLIPEVTNSYRAMPGRENFGIMGFSFGGLSACHAFWTRPHVFGSAACMSPSLWWPFPTNATFPDEAGYEFLTKTLRQQRKGRPRQKLYLDVGSQEGALMTDPPRNVSRILANTTYFTLNKNLWFYIWGKQHHDYRRVMDRLWAPMVALYGAEGSPRGGMDANEISSGQEGHQVTVFTTLAILTVCVQIL